MTRQASYDSSDPLVASVQADGLVLAASPGTATITARYQGLTDTAQVQVTAPELISIDVEPETVALEIGATKQLIVWANFTDGSRLEVTSSAISEPSGAS